MSLESLKLELAQVSSVIDQHQLFLENLQNRPERLLKTENETTIFLSQSIRYQQQLKEAIDTMEADNSPLATLQAMSLMLSSPLATKPTIMLSASQSNAFH